MRKENTSTQPTKQLDNLEDQAIDTTSVKGGNSRRPQVELNTTMEKGKKPSYTRHAPIEERRNKGGNPEI